MTLEPRNLRMTSICCFYCGSTVDSDISQTYVDYLFGIKHCSLHKSDATRDCNAYMHRNKLIDMRVAMSLPVLAPLFNQSSFTVKRSNGDLETGWCLREGSYFEPRYICVFKGEWHAPMYKEELVKHVPIKELLNAEDAATVLAALETGIYATDAAAAASCIPGMRGLDPACIGLVEHDGVVCRVVKGDLCG